ncbi:hypothetical protein GOBAR_AA10743 [Gossypium barbadense]|uniref:Uncharacterized protein n=1 Tax=Gossypium barbadense TaxID=3634 RepID=A0A2P5Y2X3_GOSBA|nr:hypothetical protein GOBAR_AA10743 [Gossypium barbadense]
MLTKFISVSETHFQNTEIALKNQQASIQGLETQIGQLAKLISERLQGNLPSNIESNPREQINAITIQDAEGLVVPEPEPSNNKEPIHEEQRLQIEKLDEWRTHKPGTHNKQSQDKLITSPNQLKVRDKVLLDAADPHIATSEPNEEIPLTVLSIFPYGIVEVFDTPVPSPHGRHCQPNTSVGEANEVRHSRVCLHAQGTRAWGKFIKSSKAHHRIGTKNSTGKGSPRLPCPAKPCP